MLEQARTDLEDEANLSTFGAYRLMTAEITFFGGEAAPEAVTWRDYDVTPGFPRLRAFLERWRGACDFGVRSVTVTDIEAATMPACRISPTTPAIH